LYVKPENVRKAIANTFYDALISSGIEELPCMYFKE
jgi:uncharacterized protein YejL (UPF0352 family)